MMRSLDGGRTWGGFRPGDNTPQPLSLKTLISGIGCHIAIGPRGEVYVTWYDNQLNALMQVKSTNRGSSWSLPMPIATIQGIDFFEGETFRNLSIPTSAVDPRNGHVYVAVASRNATGAPIATAAPALVPKIKQGTLTAKDIYAAMLSPKANDITKRKYLAGGDGEGPGSGADIILFKSTDGGQSYGRPKRVNQDKATERRRPVPALDGRHSRRARSTSCTSTAATTPTTTTSPPTSPEATTAATPSTTCACRRRSGTPRSTRRPR